MSRPIVSVALGMMLCLTGAQLFGAPHGKGGGKPGGGKPPGGNWSEGKSEGHNGASPHGEQHGNEHKPGGEGEGAGRGNENKNTQPNGAAAGAAANKNKQPNNPNAAGAAAGSAAAKRNEPNASGAEGAAAGAAASKRNQPQASGAEGAAAGAAAANRNAPKASGAEGAAAGAAAANRNQPQVSGAAGAAAGAAAANRNQPQVSGAAGAVAGSAAVRNSFDHPDIYGAQWHGDHPGAWTAAGWKTSAAWQPTGYGAVSGLCGYVGTPVSYNYGKNVTCQGGNVQVDGQTIATAEEFSQQASDLAQVGFDAETPTTDEWLPLGVFALVRNDQQHPQLILQFAINKQGILRGNYTDEVTDHTLPIHGAVDKETQRFAWTVGDNQNSVMEAGLSNLTAGEAPALLHKNGKTERWLLVRLEQPSQGAK